MSQMENYKQALVMRNLWVRDQILPHFEEVIGLMPSVAKNAFTWKIQFRSDPTYPVSHMLAMIKVCDDIDIWNEFLNALEQAGCLAVRRAFVSDQDFYAKFQTPNSAFRNIQSSEKAAIPQTRAPPMSVLEPQAKRSKISQDHDIRANSSNTFMHFLRQFKSPNTPSEFPEPVFLRAVEMALCRIREKESQWLLPLDFSMTLISDQDVHDHVKSYGNSRLQSLGLNYHRTIFAMDHPHFKAPLIWALGEGEGYNSSQAIPEELSQCTRGVTCFPTVGLVDLKMSLFDLMNERWTLNTCTLLKRAFVEFKNPRMDSDFLMALTSPSSFSTNTGQTIIPPNDWPLRSNDLKQWNNSVSYMLDALSHREDFKLKELRQFFFQLLTLVLLKHSNPLSFAFLTPEMMRDRVAQHLYEFNSRAGASLNPNPNALLSMSPLDMSMKDYLEKECSTISPADRTKMLALLEKDCFAHPRNLKEYFSDALANPSTLATVMRQELIEEMGLPRFPCKIFTEKLANLFLAGDQNNHTNEAEQRNTMNNVPPRTNNVVMGMPPPVKVGFPSSF